MVAFFKQLLLQLVADLIHENAKSGGRTLVHCLAGISRSVSLCIAYMMTHVPSKRQDFNTMNVYEALDYVKARRTIGNPNKGFMSQLIKYDPKFTCTDVELDPDPAFGIQTQTQHSEMVALKTTLAEFEAKNMK